MRAAVAALAIAVGLLAAPFGAGAAQPGSGEPGRAAAKRRRGPRNPPVTLYYVNRQETMSLRPLDEKGHSVKGMLRRFERFLRCHYTNQQHRIHPRLMRLVYQAGRHWPGRRVEVVSGYRHPSFAKNPRSPHKKGLACDFRVAGVKNAVLRDYLRRAFKNVGVGYYPNSSFVHLDVRQGHSAFWIDYSGPGERAIYSSSPIEDLKSGRADRWRPDKVDGSWAAVPDDMKQEDQEPAPPSAPSAKAEGAAPPLASGGSSPLAR